MGTLNKVLLIGNLGRDADLKWTAGGTAVAHFSIATSDAWTDKSGNPQERTEWHRITLWGKTADALAEYLTKGKQVYVEGKLQSSEYTDKEGVKRKTTEIRADRIVLLGGGERRTSTTTTPVHVRDEDVGYGEPVTTTKADVDDDIPF